MTREEVGMELKGLLSQRFPDDLGAHIALSGFRLKAAAYGYRGQFSGYQVVDGIITDDPKRTIRRRVPTPQKLPKADDKQRADKSEPERAEAEAEEEEEPKAPEASKPAKTGKKAKTEEADSRRGPQPRGLKREKKKQEEPHNLKTSRAKSKRFRR